MLSEYKGKFQHRFRSESKRYIFLNLPPKKKSGDYSAILIPEQGQSNTPLIIFKPLMKSSTLVSRKYEGFFGPICNATVFLIHKFLFWKITIHRMRLNYYSFIEMLIRTKIKEQLLGSHLYMHSVYTKWATERESWKKEMCAFSWNAKERIQFMKCWRHKITVWVHITVLTYWQGLLDLLTCYAMNEI